MGLPGDLELKARNCEIWNHAGTTRHVFQEHEPEDFKALERRTSRNRKFRVGVEGLSNCNWAAGVLSKQRWFVLHHARLSLSRGWPTSQCLDALAVGIILLIGQAGLQSKFNTQA